MTFEKSMRTLKSEKAPGELLVRLRIWMHRSRRRIALES